MLYHRLEEVALNAWPSLQQVLFDGWILRFSHGYTKRANSVQPLFGSTLDLEEKLSTCEALYRAKGSPCIFRLTPFSRPAELDLHLERRGYRRIEASQVMHLDLRRRHPRDPAGVEVREEELEDWMELYRTFRDLPVGGSTAARAMLEAIWPERRLISLRVEGQAVACGMAVREQEFVGLFDLVTAAEQRNRGHGAQLVSALLGWAQERRVEHAYLQVVQSNAAALHLYEKLGFRLAYEYWYRVQPGE
jgi:N-acetylglutamate synthase